MKTVIIDLRAQSYGRVVTNNTWPLTNTKLPLTDADYQRFLTIARTEAKDDVAPMVKSLLKKGGFYYGSDLWKWYITRTKYEFSYWLRLTFEDTNDEGKAAFMNLIYKTTILNWGKIVKGYG